MARRRLDRGYLSAAFATAVVINNNVQATYIELTFHNTDSSAREVHVREVPQGATAAANHLLIEWKGSNILRANETRTFSWQPCLDSGDFLDWKSDVANKVTCAGFVNEEAI